MNEAAWIEHLERRFGNWAIPHLTRGIVLLSALVFILGGISPDFVRLLTLEPAAIAQGEVWRLVTFLFIPETKSLLFVIFYLWFTWFVGDALEHAWGAFKLNLYFLIGTVCLAVVAFVVVRGQVDNVFLYSSLLLAFGTLFPDEAFMLFPLPLPIPAKFLALFNGLILLVTFFLSAELRLVILASVANYGVFFLPGALAAWAQRRRSQKRLKNLHRNDKANKEM